jgi:hypothetical protein
MMLISCYLHKGTVYIPTLHEIERGFHRSHEPIDVVPAEDSTRLQQSLLAAVARGNPPISRDDAAILMRSKDQPLLKIARVRSYRAFDREAKGCWDLTHRGDFYKIRVKRATATEGWKDEPDKEIRFLPETSLEEAAALLVSMIQERNRE